GAVYAGQGAAAPAGRRGTACGRTRAVRIARIAVRVPTTRLGLLPDWIDRAAGGWPRPSLARRRARQRTPAIADDGALQCDRAELAGASRGVRRFPGRAAGCAIREHVHGSA